MALQMYPKVHHEGPITHLRDIKTDDCGLVTDDWQVVGEELTVGKTVNAADTGAWDSVDSSAVFVVAAGTFQLFRSVEVGSCALVSDSVYFHGLAHPGVTHGFLAVETEPGQTEAFVTAEAVGTHWHGSGFERTADFSFFRACYAPAKSVALTNQPFLRVAPVPPVITSFIFLPYSVTHLFLSGELHPTDLRFQVLFVRLSSCGVLV